MDSSVHCSAFPVELFAVVSGETRDVATVVLDSDDNAQLGQLNVCIPIYQTPFPMKP